MDRSQSLERVAPQRGTSPPPLSPPAPPPRGTPRLRWLAGTTVASLCGIVLLLSWGNRPERLSREDEPSEWAPCADGPRPKIPPEPPIPASVEDRELLKRLQDEAIRLIDEQRVVRVSDLLKQAERTTCALRLPEPRPLGEGPVEVYARAREGVVVVAGVYKCQRCQKWHAAPASGFVIAPAGVVATNHHVVADPEKETLVVMTADGRVFPVQEILAASREDDLAILKIAAQDLTALPVVSGPHAAPVGAAISVISHPAQRFYCCTAGVVSRHMQLRAGERETEGLLITADFARGSSGAPVLNSQGQVVAVVKATESIYYSGDEGRQRNLQMVFKLCIPAADLRKLIRTP